MASKFILLQIDSESDPNTWDWATLLDCEYLGWVSNGDGTGYHWLKDNEEYS